MSNGNDKEVHGGRPHQRGTAALGDFYEFRKALVLSVEKVDSKARRAKAKEILDGMNINQRWKKVFFDVCGREFQEKNPY